MNVTLEIGSRTLDVDVEEGRTCMDLVLENGLGPDATLVFKDGRPVPIDSVVTEGSYRLVRVASGG